MTRIHYTFTGRVQHVGFRWRARKAAAAFHCTGWCRNEADGSVTMEIQGTEIQIDLVLLAIRSARRIQIEKMEAATLPVIPDETGFLME